MSFLSSTRYTTLLTEGNSFLFNFLHTIVILSNPDQIDTDRDVDYNCGK